MYILDEYKYEVLLFLRKLFFLNPSKTLPCFFGLVDLGYTSSFIYSDLNVTGSHSLGNVARCLYSCEATA